MKIDFYAPKNYYGSHILAFSGWLSFFVFIFITIFKLTSQSNTYFFFYYLPLMPFPIGLFLISMIFYCVEWLFNSKVKNLFLLKNKFYDFYFDLGLICLPFPIFWIGNVKYIKYKYLIILLILFLSIRLLKFGQNKIKTKKALVTKP